MTKYRECLYGNDCFGAREENSECDLGPCPIWSEWLNWNTCSASCGLGSTSRNRICKFGNEEDCKGDSVELSDCNLRNCPKWTSWSMWGECSKTCGTGTHLRNRECTAGEPGADCPGNSYEEQECPQKPCPFWGEWNEWSKCNEDCGTGVKSRRRRCRNGRNCPGENTERVPCNTRKCPEWAEWTNWSGCSKTCGGGQSHKLRECLYGIDCPGNSKIGRKCGEEACPTWSSWSDWTTCSQTCGTGLSSRNRNCVGGDSCPGNDAEAKECLEANCPKWNEWTEWSNCAVTCGNSTQERARECLYSTDPAQCDSLDESGPKESRSCENDPCPFWTKWGDWSVCSKSCGVGRRRKSRGCMFGPGCPGGRESAFEIDNCNTQSCSVLTQWTDFGECSVSCGSGKKTRTRLCEGGDDCEGPLAESESCNDQECPKWSNWTKFGPCSVTCGRGSQSRNRQCEGGEKGVDCFGAENDSKNCVLKACPAWSEWTDYSECPVTCGGGIVKRTRWCRNGQSKDDCDGKSFEEKACGNQSCPTWSEWSDFGACSASCGGGIKTANRICEGGEPGVDCEGSTKSVENCNSNKCPTWSAWSEYSECTQSCGIGSKSRKRVCLFTENPEECYGKGFQTEKCNSNPCPTLGEWGEFEDCSATCGGGVQKRTRECKFGSDCNGETVQSQSCNDLPCPIWSPWSKFSPCSKSCGSGGQIRSRLCQGGVAGEDCEGNDSDSQSCNDQECPKWSQWSDFDLCSATCGTGFQSRSRQCQNGQASLDCIGESTDTQSCNQSSCPKWSDWSGFGPCSENCGGGEKTRNRECNFGMSGIDCAGSDEESETCNTKPCAFWSDWSKFGSCSAECGGGEHFRERKCQHGRAGKECPGKVRENQVCNDQPCATWSVWSDFDSCSESCGIGFQSRTRRCLGGMIGVDCTGLCSYIQ